MPTKSEFWLIMCGFAAMTVVVSLTCGFRVAVLTVIVWIVAILAKSDKM